MMKRLNRTASQTCHRCRVLLYVLILVLPSLPAAGQLAITEVMSAPSTNRLVVDDFWKLTNFGTNTIDLSIYFFRDEGGFANAANLATLWAGTRGDDPPVINPGESVIWVRSRAGFITSTSDFREWWGEGRLAANLKIILYQGFGFSADGGDAVQLFRTNAVTTNLLQRVELFESVVGRSFTYDPESGILDQFSVAGVRGAFVAADSGDVGSPGFASDPVPLNVTTPPMDTEVDGGVPATFSVRAQGLPVPQYQWLFNGIPIPGATARTFTIPAAKETDAGQYAVALDNGLQQLVTSNVTLTVNTSPKCAAIVRPVEDAEACPGQAACFSVETRGYPLPVFRWQFNGADIPDATASILIIANVDASRAGLYTVVVSNALCSTNASACLRVVPWPDLRVTEAMVNRSTNTTVPGHQTWWELTNVGTNAVNLRGYRWDDNPSSLTGAVTVTNDVILLPGHSVIFVSSMSAASFRRWWGEENLPAGLPIISYFGNGLSSSGDAIHVWNAAAREGDMNMLDLFVLDQTVPPAVGFSLEYDPEFNDLSIPSVTGRRGAFQAVESDDVGSPGWTSNEQRAAPRYLSIRQVPAGFVLRWKTEPGYTYTIQRCSDLAHANWTNVLNLPALGPWLSTTNPPDAGADRSFYRVRLQPLAP